MIMRRRWWWIAMRIPVGLALLLCSPIRRSLAISRSLAIRSRAVAVMVLLNDHRRCRRRSLLATAKDEHHNGRK